jgi:DNA-binding MarR family transcriptional regulator
MADAKPDTQHPTPDTRRLGFLLKHAQAGLSSLTAPALAVIDLDGRQFAVLAEIGARGPIAQQRVSEALRVDRTTIVALVDELERKGLVERKRDPSDRRAYAVELTPKGRRTLERALTVVGAAEREFLGSLSEADRRRLRELLARVV